METVRVNLGPRSYEIVVTTGGLNELGTHASRWLSRTMSALVAADENVISLSNRITDVLPFEKLDVVVIPSGEKSKSQEVVQLVYDVLAEIPADRQTAVVAVGGGVIGDLAGFAAATYNRGLPLFMVPTTLLAMVDSSVGGKVGINHPKGKNLIGAFHQPAGVWIDTDFLKTLPDREYRSGLAEAVKYGVILDAEFFEWLEKNRTAIRDRDPAVLVPMIAKCCQLKARVVEQDEREETGLRAVLNYGHTFAHAFETVGGYGSWLHGEAVSAGMICASRLAARRGLIDPSLTHRQRELLAYFELPTEPRPEWPTDELLAIMRRDKKNHGGKLRFVLPTRLGEVKLFDDVPDVQVVDLFRSKDK